MVKYLKEPDNPTKSFRARGSHLRVHFKALECSIHLLRVVEASQKRIRDLERSNTALRKEVAEAKAAVEAAERRAKEAEERAKAAESTLKAERELWQLEVNSLKEELGNLEKEKAELTNQLKGIAFKAMAKERYTLMKQFLAGDHKYWTPEKWIQDYEKMVADSPEPSAADGDKEDAVKTNEDVPVSKVVGGDDPPTDA